MDLDLIGGRELEWLVGTEKGFKVNRGNNTKKRVVLSDRDFEILQFILEMKFASLDEVCAKFFKGSPVDQNIVGYWYAKKRLSQLEKAGYLASSKRFSETKRFYFATKLAYSALSNLFLGQTLLRPIGSIDGRTVAHDYLVLRMRLALEKRGLCHSWISDRSLKIQTGILSELKAGYSPDGVYQPLQGPAVAFELEIALKSKARYQAKIKKYIDWIQRHSNTEGAFRSVHFVTTSAVVKAHLESFSAIYRSMFKIEMVGEYIDGEVGLR